MAAIKKLLNWALNRGMIDVNPIAGLSAPGKKTARERILHELEILRLFEVTKAEGYPFGTIYELLLYTGQRRGEVSGMRWSEIDFDRRVWTIPVTRSKNGSAHEVPLATPVLDILGRIPRFLGSNFVFTTTGATPISGFGRAKHRVEVAVGASDWWVHDLRRTAASGMARLGVAPHVIEKVLNHKTGQISGVAAVYNRYGYETEKRDAIERWTTTLTTMKSPFARGEMTNGNGNTKSSAFLAA
jgi:integrase